MEPRVEVMTPHVRGPHKPRCHRHQLQEQERPLLPVETGSVSTGWTRTHAGEPGGVQRAQVTEHQAEAPDQLLLPLCPQTVTLVLSCHLPRGYFSFLKAWAAQHEAPSIGPSVCTEDAQESFGL